MTTSHSHKLAQTQLTSRLVFTLRSGVFAMYAVGWCVCVCVCARLSVCMFVCFMWMISNSLCSFAFDSSINEVWKEFNVCCRWFFRWPGLAHIYGTFSRSCTAEFIRNKWNKGNFSCSHSRMLFSILPLFADRPISFPCSLSVELFFTLFRFSSINFSIIIRYLIVYLRFPSCAFFPHWCSSSSFSLHFSPFIRKFFRCFSFLISFLNFVPPNNENEKKQQIE